MDEALAQTTIERQSLGLARQNIEYLRRLYGVATDALGKVDDAAEQAFGLKTFRRIFAPDAVIRVTGSATPLQATGPEGWAEVVTNALREYEVTQHLIGTQIVTFDQVTFANDDIESGAATMTSYLHAWHVWPDRKLRLVMGTYIDRVVFNPDIGWQIIDMTLAHTSAEHRMLGDMT